MKHELDNYIVWYREPPKAKPLSEIEIRPAEKLIEVEEGFWQCPSCGEFVDPEVDKVCSNCLRDLSVCEAPNDGR